jgi:hypothetical protein
MAAKKPAHSILASGIAVRCAHTRIANTVDLVAFPRNPNTHSDKQLALLAKIIKSTGWRNPIVVSKRSGFITKGHGRMAAAMLLKLDTVPIDEQDYDSEAQEWADVIADNRIAELADMNEKRLAELVRDLDALNYDSQLLGFTSEEAAALVAQLDPAPSAFEDISPVLAGAHALKTDMLFPSDLPHDIPMLRADMLASMPEPIETWCGERVSRKSENYFYNHNSDSLRGLDIHKTVLGFYVDDFRFEATFNDAAAFATRILNAGFVAAVTPNFSVVPDWPGAINLYNTFRTRWVGRYWQEAGIRIIPDVQTGFDVKGKAFDFATIGIPKNAPCISVQAHMNFKEDQIKNEGTALKGMIEQLKPQSIFVMSGASAREIVELAKLPKSLHVIFCDGRNVVKSEFYKKEKLDKKTASVKVSHPIKTGGE